MSEIISKAVELLSDKMSGEDFDGSAKFVIDGEGAVIIEGASVRAADEDADVTLSADVDTFLAMVEGDMQPTAAFMSGKLSVDGDMGQAMKLASILA